MDEDYAVMTDLNSLYCTSLHVHDVIGDYHGTWLIYVVCIVQVLMHVL